MKRLKMQRLRMHTTYLPPNRTREQKKGQLKHWHLAIAKLEIAFQAISGLYKFKKK